MKQITLAVGVWVGLLTCGLSLAQDSDTVPLVRTMASGSSDSPLSLVQKPSGPGLSESIGSSSSATGGKEKDTTKPYVASLDTYGSSRINEVILRKTLGSELDEWLKLGLKGEQSSITQETRLAKKIRDKFGFAQADWSIVQYFVPGDMAIHITLDVVEPQDVAKRMPFLASPTGQFKDPDHLIASWRQYENIAMDLVQSGQLEPESEKCVAFHCPFGHKNAKLKKYEKIFVDGVKKNLNQLVQIQSQDRRGEYRAAATYLLAYAKDGRKVVSWMEGRIKDPDQMVRNNALRVLGDIAEFHPDLVIPLKPVIEALNFPRTSDRTKAVYVLYLTAMNSEESRALILKSAFPLLLDLMASTQPDSREMALGLMKKISGKSFPATDRISWEHWFSHLPKDRLPTND